ncbi:G-type lectin S-receptor-like serine/threonine-protein kinase At2g19130 isoform X2 [Aristolochia californica]
MLTSWRSSDDPAPGPFSLEIDRGNSSQYFIFWNKTKIYWTSGNWTGKLFNRVPEMTSNYIYDFNFTENAESKYFTYSLYETSIISRFVMDVSGQIIQVTWLDTAWNLFWSQPRDHCDVYSLCGAFGNCDQTEQSFCKCLRGFKPRSMNEWNSSDWSSGCIRNTPLQCENSSLARGDRDGFSVMPKMQLPENSKTLTVENAESCKLACLDKCSCTAYAYGTEGCLYWNGDLQNLRQLSEGDSKAADLYIRLAASELQNPRSKKRSFVGIAVGISVGLVVAISIVLVLSWEWKRRNLAASKAVQGNLVAFSYRDLQVATKTFSERLGGGGFGSVYRGILPDSDVVAVKKLEALRQGEKQFRSEVSTIGNIQHVNLIRLRGFCSEGAKRLLVYDYMPNRSLDTHLFYNHAEVLNWNRRYQIVLGTARGLAYLHEKCRDCIIHCDIKPENVLLDDGFCPKVADFGLAKLMGREFSRVLTTMRGTRGYLAPEWISGVPITPKADVYSYGMMLFEVISGKRNMEQSEDGKFGFFPTRAAKRLAEGEVISLLDPRLGGDVDIDELERVCKVACWCIQDDESTRPSMGQIVQVFEGDLGVNMPPIPRALEIFTENMGAVPLSSNSSATGSSWSHNIASISQDRSVSSSRSK